MPLPFRIETHLAQLRRGEWSDFTILCRDKEFRVHRNIVCPESDFFDTVCKKSFKEAKDCVVDLSEDDPEIISRLLFYLYSGDYSCDVPEGIGVARSWVDRPNSPTSPALASSQKQTWTEILQISSPETTEEMCTATHITTVEQQAKDCLQIHAKMYVVADRLGITSLRNQACREFKLRAFQPPLVPLRTKWFSDILRYILENTTKNVQLSNDDGHFDLRSQLVTAVLMELISDRDIVPMTLQVVEEHEPLAFKLSRIFECQNIRSEMERQSLQTDLDSVTEENKSLRMQVSLYSSKLESTKVKVEELSKQLENSGKLYDEMGKNQERQLRCLSIFMSCYKFCGRCVREFGWVGRIEFSSNGKMISVACSRCGEAITLNVQKMLRTPN